MRIIGSDKNGFDSRFDYYDGVQSEGQDQSLIYLRTPEEVTYYFEGRWDREGSSSLPKWPFPGTRGLYLDWGQAHFDTLLTIGFCGKLYPAIEMHCPSISTRDRVSRTAIAYTMEEVDAFVEEFFSKKEVDSYYEKDKRWRNASMRRKEYIEWFDAVKAMEGKFEEMFRERRCPVFVGRHRRYYEKYPRIVFNDILKPLEFARIMPPYQAYQEISMFLGNLAAPEKSIPHIDDRTLLEIKGFDRFSFRKPKS